MPALTREISTHETGLELFLGLRHEIDGVIDEVHTRMVGNVNGDNTVPGSHLVFTEFPPASIVFPRQIYGLAVITGGEASDVFMRFIDMYQAIPSKDNKPVTIGGALHVYGATRANSNHGITYDKIDGSSNILGYMPGSEADDSSGRILDSFDSSTPVGELDGNKADLIRSVVPAIETGLFIARLLLDNREPAETFAEFGFTIRPAHVSE